MKTKTVAKIRNDFPIFKYHPGLVYLDSTATALKPQSVIDALIGYYSEYSSNIFRGLYPLSQKATKAYEDTRKLTAKFINARSHDEIIFTRNTTESLNLLAYTLEQRIEKGDEIITTIAEHHSNFVPWQQLAKKKKASFKVIDITPEGTIDLEALEKTITKKTKILALTYISNVLGTTNPITKIAQIARKINKDIIIVVDAAQAAPHLEIDVQDLNVDFLAFSSHKMLGPTSVGILWGKKEQLETLPPFLFGGEMIEQVEIEQTTFNTVPHKFEAGTPAIGEVIAFKAALEYLQKIGLEKIRKHEYDLTTYAMKKMKETFGNSITFLGPQTEENKTGIIAFTFKQHHPHDIADILGEQGICVRAGHHCAQPLHKHLNQKSSTRISFYLYNDRTDVDKFITGLQKVDEILS